MLVTAQLAQVGQHYCAVTVACLSFLSLWSMKYSFCLLKYGFIPDIYLQLEISHSSIYL